VHLDIVSPGDISSFFWAHSQAPPSGLVECNVAYGELLPVSLSFTFPIWFPYSIQRSLNVCLWVANNVGCCAVQGPLISVMSCWPMAS
jgi:hypothetical protein